MGAPATDPFDRPEWRPQSETQPVDAALETELAVDPIPEQPEPDAIERTISDRPQAASIRYGQIT